MVTQGIEPEAVLVFFEEISAIPRGSGNEKGIADYLVKFAEKRGLPVYRDAVHNVFIRKPASKGSEEKPALLLQGHTDIVCEKNEDVIHDFLKDPIQLTIDGDWLHARGTTLGADNGIAVAYMLAALDDHELVHPALECLFTVQEEIGLCGAKAFDASIITAKNMINLDCGPEGVSTVSCAGGMCIEMEKTFPLIPFSGAALKISVHGLMGGHSGGEIHRYRGNSNKIMARILYKLGKGVSLISFNGGSKHNAIPRECVAVVAVPCAEAARKGVEQTAVAIMGELGEDDKNFRVTVEEITKPSMMGAQEQSWQAISLMFVAPNGVLAMSHEMEGLVDASVNMGVVATIGSTLHITFAPRASRESLNDDTEEKLRLLADMFGFTMETSSRYFSWPYSKESPLRDMVVAVYHEMTGETMELQATHGGLECGILLSKVPGLDIVAIGPTAKGAHSPEERLNLPSTNRVWLFLQGIIRRLAE